MITNVILILYKFNNVSIKWLSWLIYLALSDRILPVFAQFCESVQCQVVEKKQCLLCLPSDPNVRKEWMNFIFNEVPDHISKNSVFCSLCFTADYTNKAQFDAGFSKSLKLKDDAVPTILDPTVMSQHTSVSNCFYYLITIALSVKQIIWFVLSIYANQFTYANLFSQS